MKTLLLMLAPLFNATLATNAAEPWRFEMSEVIYENPLSNYEDVEDWVIESSMSGHPAMTFPHGKMRLESDVHFLLWCPEEFPDNIAVSWEFQPRRDDGLAMFWLAAKGRNGESIFDPALKGRDGTYEQYRRGDINALHMSYFRRNHAPERDGFHEINFQTVNLRKSHGHHLVAMGGDPIPSTRDAVRPYEMQVVKYGSHFQLAINDVVVMQWYDDGEKTGPVLGGGKIGFRQMRGLIADYANLKVREVTGIEQAR